MEGRDSSSSTACSLLISVGHVHPISARSDPACNHHKQPSVHPAHSSATAIDGQASAFWNSLGLRSPRGAKRYALLFIPPSNQHNRAVNILVAMLRIT